LFASVAVVEAVVEEVSMGITDRVAELAQPVALALGAEIVDVEWHGGLLRVVVDQPGGVTTDTLTEVNRRLSALLDQHDPVPGRYTLEVSSPGVERPLSRADHWARAVGEVVVVKLGPGHEVRRLKGVLRRFDGQVATVEVTEIDGVDRAEATTRQVPLSEVTSARTVFDWGPAPKPGARTGTDKPAKKRAAP
jgi:ribosome maturation factor RimP